MFIIYSFDICDTQEKERRLDDIMKRTKLFDKGADCGMRLGIGGQDLVIFRELCLKFFRSRSKKGQQNMK